MNSIPLPIHLLLADDDNDDCMLFQEALTELALSVDLSVVNDGEQLMNYLKQHQNFSGIVFLDLNMPRKNGLECLTEIKMNEQLKKIPIIIISTSYDEDMVNGLLRHSLVILIVITFGLWSPLFEMEII